MATQQYGMFGPNPSQVQAMQDAAAQKEAMDMGTMFANNMYAPSMASMVGINQGLAKGVGQLFGVQDPAMQQAQQMEQIKQEIQALAMQYGGGAEGNLRAAAEVFTKYGMADKAAAAEQQLAEIGKTRAEAEYKAAQTKELGTKYSNQQQKSEFVTKNASLIAELPDEQKQGFFAAVSDPTKSVTDLSQYLKKPTKYEKVDDLYTDTNKPLSYDPYKAAYMVNTESGLKPYYGDAKTTKGVNVTVPVGVTVNNDETLAGTFRESKKRFDESAIAIRDASREAQAALERIKANPKIYTGSFAGFRTSVMNVLASVGLLTPEQAKTVSDEQLVDALTGSAMFARMQQLGGNDSEEELRQAKKLIANRETQKEGMLGLLNWTIAKQRFVDRVNAALKKGLSQHRKIQYFDYTTGMWLPETGKENGDFMSITDEEAQRYVDKHRKSMLQQGIQPNITNAKKFLRRYYGM